MGNYIGFILLILYHIWRTEGNVLDVTGFNLKPILNYAPGSSEDTFFGGYKSGSDTGATITLGRALDTGTGPLTLPQISGVAYYETALEGKAYRIRLKAPFGLPSIGAFYINASKDDVSHSMITITMAQSANVKPESQTKTVSLGQNVNLMMTLNNQPSELLQWRFNGVVRNEWLDSTLHINSVTKADEGIYECYVIGDPEGRQAIMRLIVRDCAPSVWGPSCQQECPICYNGGVCDAQTGLCVCPPGFGGTNCVTVYGRNKWGNDGGLACSSGQTKHGPACRGALFCRPDPYGCSCIAGYEGLDCMTECDSGTFGAGCAQQCHCVGNSCLLDTGECTPGAACEAGWRGVNCQVPYPCPVGYYGNLCTQRCRCINNERCHDQTGYCDNGCQEGYIGDECNEDGSQQIASFNYEKKVNSGAVTTLICTVTGNPMPRKADVMVTNSNGELLTINGSNKVLRSYKRNILYAVNVTTSGENFTCSLTLHNGTATQTRFTVDVYTPPVVPDPPTINEITASSVRVGWQRWQTAYGGDGPVMKYIVKYRYTTSIPDAAYPYMVEQLDARYISLEITGLDWDTEYDFVVVAVRDGERGEGPASPKTTARTVCDTPEASPIINPVTAHNSTTLVVSWQLPPEATWRCRTLQNMYIVLEESTNLSNYASIIVDLFSGNVDSVAFTSLEPCTMYDIRATIGNSVGSGSFSETTSGNTSSAVPGPVLNLQAQGVPNNSSLIQVTWRLPNANACPVDSYQVTFTKVERKACAGSLIMMKNMTVPSSDVVFMLHDLEPYVRYLIFVSAMNSMGEGETTSTMAATVSDKPSAAPLTELLPLGAKNRLKFTWRQLDCTKINGPFHSYKYQLLNSSNGIVRSKQLNDQFQDLRNATFEDLTPCTEYGFRIRVRTDKGNGPYSKLVMGTTEVDVPGPVSMLHVPSANITPYEMFIQWEEPTHPPCLTDNYKVRLDLIDRDQCSANVTSNPNSVWMNRYVNITATGLLPYSSYKVTVKAMTTSGLGEAMTTMATTKESVPSEGPSNIQEIGVSTNSLAFSWHPPPCGFRGGLITKYSYKIRDLLRNNIITKKVSEGISEVTINDLTAFVEYQFEVKAFTSAGSGPYSDPIVVRTSESRPAALTNVTTPSANSESILVRWYPPNPPLANITAYNIEYWLSTEGEMDNELRTIQWSNVSNPLPYEYRIVRLRPQTSYSIRIQGINSQGMSGLFSETVQEITMEDIPSVPVNLQLVSKEEMQVTISWGIPKEPQGDIIQYSVRYKIIEKLYDRRSKSVLFPYENLTATGPTTRRITINNLEPSTKYRVEVAASTKAGKGDYAGILVYTKPPTDFERPKTKPGFAGAVGPATSIQLTLSPVTSKYVTHIQIRVDKKSFKREVIGSYQDNPNSYVAAELDKDITDFMVGDNKTYGGFTNPPLQIGATYDIYQGAASKSDNLTNVLWSPPVRVVNSAEVNKDGMGGNPDGQGGSDMTSVIVGVVMGIAVVCFLAAIIAFVLIKKRRHEEARLKTSDETNLTQLNNVLVSKNDTNTRGKLKNTNSELPHRNPQMKHFQSEDALTNINTSRTTVRVQPGSPLMKAPAAEKHSPIRIDDLADYVKNKQSETNDGFKLEYTTLPEGKHHPWTVAMKPENKLKNRYANIIAYDHSRVKLKLLEGDPHSDYINASYLDGYDKANAYIACQGANMASINDMWRMIWQEKTAKIVMVTNLNEGGKKKCEKYWPERCKTYRDIEVKLVNEENFPNYCTRTFSLQKDEEMRELKQFHYISWPDMGVPSYATPLLKFITATKEYNPPKSGPTIVHCSAGVGRTGTFVTISSMLDQAKQEHQVDVYNFILNLRNRRIKMVQTAEQYVFIFDALLEALLCGDTSCETDNFCSEFHRLKTKTNSAGKSLMQEQFETLEIVSVKPSPQKCRGGCDPLNVNKNRYRERLPFDKYRPYLMTEAGENCTNYINASFVDGYIRRNMFFATQMPLSNTALDFWRLIFDYNSNTIVMLNAMDHNDASLCQYWPETGNISFGPFTIELISTDNSPHHIITRTFHLTNDQRKSEKPREIRQFQYTGWPNNHAVPKTPDTLLELYSQVERWCPRDDTPITVHCLDGMGVTGTFCALFMVLDRLKTEQSIDVFQAVKKLRMTRTNMVNTLEQYIFCFETVLAYLDSMELYGNFK